VPWADRLTTFMCQWSGNFGTSTFWNPQGLSKLVQGLFALSVHTQCLITKRPLVTGCRSQNASPKQQFKGNDKHKTNSFGETTAGEFLTIILLLIKLGTECLTICLQMYKILCFSHKILWREKYDFKLSPCSECCMLSSG